MMLRVEPPAIRRLRGLLDDLGYDAVQRTLRADYHRSPFPAFGELDLRTAMLPRALACAYRLLMLGQAMSRTAACDGLGAEAIVDLLDLGLIADEGRGQLRACDVSLLSLDDRYFVASLSPFYPTCRDRTFPIYMGADSYEIAHALPYGRPTASMLDLCTGSGLQAICYAPWARRVTAIDLHPRAVEAARFNAALNGLDTIRVLEGSLYRPVQGETFELIVSSCPCIAVPAGARFPMFGNGGQDGLEVLGPTLDQLSRHLAPGGSAIMRGSGHGDDRAPFLAPLLHDLAHRDGFRIELRIVSAANADAALHQRAVSLSKLGFTAELDRWRDAFARSHVRYTYGFFIEISRGEPSFRSSFTA